MRLLLSGYYGFGNLGDEALLEVIVAQVRSRFPAVQIDVLSAQPEATSRALRVDATPRWSQSEVRRAIARADVVLSGGGGLLQNATSLRSLLYYAGIVRAAARTKRRAMIFAQSIGPLDFWGRTVVREWCRGVVRATVRDERSRTLLASLLPHTPVERTADPVFLYDVPEDGAVDLRSEGIDPAQGAPLVVVSVRKTAQARYAVEAVARAVDRLGNAHGAHVAFLPLGGAADAEVSAAVIRRCKSAPVLLPEMPLARAANVIRQANVLVGMRLHALILAARYGVPFLAIPYDPKVAALCEDLAYPLPPLVDLTVSARRSGDAIDELVDRLMERRDALRAHLLAHGARSVELAGRNFEVLGELLGEQAPA